MLTKDIMATKMEENQIMKIDADAWQIHCVIYHIGNPIIIRLRKLINRAPAPCARDLRGTCDTLACMCTRRSKDLRVTCE